MNDIAMFFDNPVTNFKDVCVPSQNIIKNIKISVDCSIILDF